MAEGALTSFLADGTTVLEWIMKGCTTVLNFITSNPATMIFLLGAVVYLVVRVIKSFVRI